MKRTIALILALLMLFSILPTALAEERGETRAANNFVGYPSVFVTEDNYHISFLTNTNGMAWVEIGGVAYEDTTAGLMDWETKLHGITVPQSVLNSAKSYTICFQALSEKPAYDAAPGAKQTKTYSFNPVLPGEDPVLLCVSDQHDNNTGAAAVTKYGNFDAVVFGGDYTAAISTEDIANNFLKYSGEISKGTKPVIYPRGNHEIRGQYTHWVDQVMPTSSTGKSYYELLLGDVYAIVLDCGGSYTDNYEDIADTIDYEPYRVEQTRWLEQVYLKGTWKQYDKRIIISHVPFITQANFKDIFTDWTTILNRMDMSVLVSGHTHAYTVYGTNHSSVKTAPNFPAFVMSTYTKDPYVYTGTFLTLGDQNFTINHVDSSSLSVKNTYTFTNKTYGATTEPKTVFETAVAETPAPAASASTASIPAVSSPFSAHPTVFITEDNYQISFLTEETGMAWVEIGGVKYKDSTMGVMDWESKIHKITVPQSVLDSARKYKICFQSMSTRKAYTPVHGSTVSRTYPFTPAPASPTFLFMSEQLNDNTNAMKVAAYKNYDVFVCGGKYMKAANTEGNRSYLLKLCGETTQGVIPTIFTRGNRELRGFAAHDVVDSMGTSSTGEAYFYFTTSNIFGIVLDTGEYAADSTASFGGTVRFQKYREQQTRWLRELLAEGKWKAYDTRIVICHIPFTAYTDSSMKAVFKEWTNVLNEMGVTLMVAGHVNNYSYYPVGDSRNVSGPNFPMLTMSDLDNGDYAYSGTYVTFNGKTFTTENVLSTKKVREKKTVTNPLYVEEPELVSDYTPTGDQNVLYFGFGNNPEDYQRYTENPVYGGANYDTANILRTQNFYNGKGAIDFPVADIQNFDYTTGTVRTKVNGPYPTQSSYTGCVTRRFVFGETNDTTASVGSLKYKPTNAEVFQVRFKLENLKLRSDISASDAARCVSLQYYKNTATSAVRNANSYGGSVVNGKYMTVTLNLDSGFRGADVITKFWVEFHGFFKSDDSKDAYVTLDYVYIGPKATMPTKDDSYLFFNYTDSTAAHYRYASNSYSGYNFDLETRWNVERKDPATGNTVTVSKTIDKEEGTLNFSFSDWDTQIKSTIFGTYEGGVTPLNYNPSKAEVVQVRFKMNNIKAATNANPFIRLWYTKNVNGTNQSAYDQAYSLGTNFVSDGEWMVVTIPLYTQAEINANASVSGFPTTTFAKAGTIVGVRMGFHNFTANAAGVPGEIIVDYIYVGPKSDMPSKIYTVNFYGEDGTLLQTNQVNHGESVSYTGSEPTKAPDAENHYTFGGWVAQQGGSAAVNLNNVQANTDAYPFFAPTGHAVAYKDAQDATCTAPGYTGDSYCTECGYAIASGEEIPALGHTELIIPGSAATCTENGLTEGKYCEICNENLLAQEVIPATGHTVITVPGTSADCINTGLTEGAYCTVCEVVLTEQEVIPATGHTSVATPAKDPTCTAEGLTEGSYCSVCNEVLTAQEVIPATGHSYSETVTPPTCTLEGKIAYTCSVCGHSYEEAGATATGHSYSETVTPPTCTADGYTTYTCSVCGHSYEGVGATATGHSYTETVTPPTCTADGYTTYTCSICNHSYVEPGATATGHSYTETVTPPTCTADGKITYICSVCGHSYEEAGETATGHVYTYTKIDGQTHTVGCENCDLSDTASHTYENGTCVCGDAEIKEPITDSAILIGHSLNLASDISVNFVAQVSQVKNYVNHRLVVEIPVYTKNEQTGTKTVTIEPVLNGSYYYFTLTGLTAVNMGDVVSAQLHMEKDGQPYVSNVDTYSIAKYAYAQLNKAEASTKLKALCADLLRYGKEAQVYKTYRTDALVDAAMTETHRSYLSDASVVTFGYNNETLNDLNQPVINWLGKALNLESKVSVKFIFDLGTYSGNLEDLTMKVRYVNRSGATVEQTVTDIEAYDAAKNRYAFSFDGLLAAELRSVVEVAVYQGETRLSKTVRYSPDTYAKNTSGQLLILCKALFAYSDTAKAYFG